MRSEDKPTKRDRHPFADISGVKIIAGAVGSFIIMIFLIPLTENMPVLSEADSKNILFAVFLLLILTSILLQFRNYSHLWSFTSNPPNRTESWKILLVVIPLIILSLGTGWLWDFIQLQLFPSNLEDQWQWRSENLFLDPNGSFISFTIAFSTIVIIAPTAEEVLFRGVIFDKISLKWGSKTGILLSSLIFGLLHINPLGTFIFGSVMCLIYLQMDSLFIPIACHTLNNLVVVLLSFTSPGEIKLFESTQQLYTQSWIGISFLLIGGIGLFWWIYNLPNFSPND